MSYEDEELARIQAETARRKQEIEALQREELRRIQELERQKNMGLGEGYSPEMDSAFVQSSSQSVNQNYNQGYIQNPMQNVNHGNQGYGAQGYGAQGYGAQGGNPQGYGAQGYGNQGFDPNQMGYNQQNAQYQQGGQQMGQNDPRVPRRNGSEDSQNSVQRQRNSQQNSQQGQPQKNRQQSGQSQNRQRPQQSSAPRRRTFDPDQAVSDEEYLGSYEGEPRRSKKSNRNAYRDEDMRRDYDEEEYERPRKKSSKSSKSRQEESRKKQDYYDESPEKIQKRMNKNKKKKKKSPVKRFFRNLIIILLVLLLAFGAAVWNVTRKFNKMDTEVGSRASSMKHKTVNILLIGQDARDGQEGQRSDSMIIVSINQKENTACLISIMRDTYVDIPGYGGNRINAAYAYGGIDLLDQTIEQNFDITIDGNMMVDFNGFLDAMSAIGSLKMDLTAEEAQYMNENPALGSNNDESDEEWSLTEGENKLTPSQILCYSRMRYVGNSDWDRTERQRKVISGVVSQVKHGHFIKGYKVANEAAPSITTDLGNWGMMRMASGLMTSGDMDSYIIPAEGTYYADNVNGMAVLVPDLEANKKLIKDYMEGNVESTESEEE